MSPPTSADLLQEIHGSITTLEKRVADLSVDMAKLSTALQYEAKEREDVLERLERLERHLPRVVWTIVAAVAAAVILPLLQGGG